MRLVISDRAEQDLVDIAGWYAREGGIDLAKRFVQCVAHTLAQLLDMPRLGRPLGLGSRLQPLRAWAVRGFDRYLVVYRPENEVLMVVRVVHGNRDLKGFLGQPGDSVHEPRLSWHVAIAAGGGA